MTTATAATTTATKAQPLTADELQQAFELCRGRGWPATLREAMTDERRAKLIQACATGQRTKVVVSQARRARWSAPASTAPIPQQPLLAHWPAAARARPPSLPGTQSTSMLPCASDRKRLAGGDRDD